MAGNEGSREAQSLLSIARAEGEAAPMEPLRLGERVRSLRRSRNWTLEEASRRAGLARSTLSKIENEQMSPTFDAVQKLAHGLGIDVPQLFTPAASPSATGRRSVTRAGEGRPHPTVTYDHELLASEITRKRMLPYKTLIRARGFDEFNGWIRHEGEEFLLVIAGAIQFLTEFYEPAALGAGDSAYYDASMGHCVISTSPEDAEILWVTTV